MSKCINCSKNAHREVKKYFDKNPDNFKKFLKCFSENKLNDNAGYLFNYFNYFDMFTKYIHYNFLHENISCKKCKNTIKISYVYIYSAIKSLQYNLLLKPNLIDLVQDSISYVINHKSYQLLVMHHNENLISNIKTDLEYLRYILVNSHLWKGSDYYYQKIFRIPRILNDLKNPHLEIHYINRNNDFCDSICGHPKASNGWYKESLDNLIQLNCLN